MKSFPFDSEVTYDEYGMPTYDRGASSQELRAYYHLLYTDGVFPNPSTGLQVAEYGQEMSVSVRPGSLVIQGALGIEENERVLVFEASGSTYDRIDAVVARLNTNYEYRKIDLYIVKGTESDNPVAPGLTREGGIYELRLANVFIAKNTTMISAERITDTRLHTEDCGIVTCNPDKVDTTSLFIQYQGALDQFVEKADRLFYEWFDSVKDQLDEDAAGNLLGMINRRPTSTGIRDIQVVETLPEDAAGHPDTLYAVVDVGTIVETQDLPVQRRRAIFRGKNLGSAVTAAQWEGIAAGTFHDMFTGDYWEADGVRWVVADFDYFLGYGSGEGTTRHHVVILPDRILGRGKMNDTETNETGYHGCGMRSSGLDTVRERIAGVFGQERLLTYKSYMTNSASGGMLWADAVVEIPSAGMVLGTGTTRAIENGQLALFSLDRQSAVADREGYWLSGLQGKTSFDEMRPEGYVSSLPANVSAGIRPVFAIAGD